MAQKVVPMIHVPDVRATVDWYLGLGFTVIDTYGDEGDGLSFAMLSFGSSEVMFSSGGQPSTRDRREVDLYVYSDNVDDLYRRLKDRVEVVKGLHGTFYALQSYVGKYKGEREFEINVTYKDGKLFAALGRQQPLSLMAVDQTTFRPIAFDNFGSLTFNVEVGKTMGCSLNHGDGTMQLKRAEETKRL